MFVAHLKLQNLLLDSLCGKKKQAHLDTGDMTDLQSQQNINLLIHIRVWLVSSGKFRLEYCTIT